MPILLPGDCALDSATQQWMLAALVGLVVACICLLAQVGLLARRLTRHRVARWWWLLLALTGLWTILCGMIAVQAWDEYHTLTTLWGKWGSALGLCFSAGWIGKETQIALIGAAVLLVLGWLALFVLRLRQLAA